MNIQDLTCSQDSYFAKEYERIFIGNFGRNAHYKNIIAHLAKNKYATKEKIEQALKIGSGGRTTHYLENLELSGFIESFEPIDASVDTKLRRYRIIDNYLLFYFRFIKPKLSFLKKSKGAVSLNKLISEQQYSIWRGLAFEQFCYNHHFLIAKKLGFSGVRYDCGPYYKRADIKSGTQVDLLFKRADNVISLCEVKWRKNLQAKQVASDIEKKREQISNLRYHHVETVLISAYPVPLEFHEYFNQIITVPELF